MVVVGIRVQVGPEALESESALGSDLLGFHKEAVDRNGETETCL